MLLTDPREGERLEIRVERGRGAAGGGLDQLPGWAPGRAAALLQSRRWSPASARPTGWRTRSATGIRRRFSSRARSGAGRWRSGFRGRDAPTSAPPLDALELRSSHEHRILDRLEMGVHDAVRHRVPDLLLDLLQQVVSPLHRPVARHQDVERDEPPGAGLPGSEGVVADAIGRPGVEDPGDRAAAISSGSEVSSRPSMERRRSLSPARSTVSATAMATIASSASQPVMAAAADAER